MAALAGCGRSHEPAIVRAPHSAIDAKIIDGLLTAIDAGRYGDMHSLTIVIDGETVLDAYFNGHRRERRQPLYSVTKSVLSAVVGIAIGDGLIPSADSLVLELFDEYPSFAHHDRRKARITIEHLRMRSTTADLDAISTIVDENRLTMPVARILRFDEIPAALDDTCARSWPGKAVARI